MDPAALDSLKPAARVSLTRRRLARLLGGSVSLATLLATLRDGEEPATARRVHGEHNRREGGKKTIMCYQDQTVRVATKQRRKWLHKGATRGKCSGCTPVCAPGTCGDDGCGGTCSCDAGTVCDGAACQPCTVSCTGSPKECGETLRATMKGASAGDTIYICPGTYQGGFVPPVSLQLYGSGDGNDPTVDTILDGNNSGTVLTLNVLEVTIFGMRITNAFDLQGGIDIGSGDVTILNCTITENRADYFGGGIVASTANLTIRNSAITNNSANFSGGGLFITGATAEISNCVISENIARDGGAGLLADGATISLVATAITDNDASSGVTKVGGGMRLAGGTTTFDSACSITGNKAGPGNSGGGIFGESGAVAVLNGATVSGNTPDQCAGTVSC